MLRCVGVGTLCAVYGALKPLFLARKRRKAVWGRLASSHGFSMGQRWSRVQRLTDVRGLPLRIGIKTLFEIQFRVWRKKEKNKSEAISLTLSIFSARVIPVCMQIPAPSLRRGGRNLPAWMGQTAAFLRTRGKGGVWSAKGEKCQHLSVTARQMANYNFFFFPAALSCSQTKPPSSRLCRPRHFPPPLHLWYANGKTERFCAAQKDLWAHSLGQQSQLLRRGSACCASTGCQGTSLPPAPPF